MSLPPPHAEPEPGQDIAPPSPRTTKLACLLLYLIERHLNIDPVTFIAYFISVFEKMNIFSDCLANDPGTDRTLLYTAKDGIVINAPSAIAVRVKGNSQPHTIAVGEKAGNG